MREALGGRWVANLTGWILLLIPTTLFVIVQESPTQFPDFSYVIGSALAQHLVSLPPIVLVALLLRRRRLLPLWWSFLLWSLIGVTRGVVGGIIAAPYSDPDYVLRIVSYLALALVWMPITVYLLAQLDHRRGLVRALATATRMRDEARLRAERSTEEIRQQLIATVAGVVGPVLDEIRQSLRAATGAITPDQLKAISERLSRVTADSARTVERLTPERFTHRLTARRPAVPVFAALDFERRRPLLSGILTGAALIALFVPLALRLGEQALSLATVAAVFGTALVLTLSQFLVRTRARDATQTPTLARICALRPCGRHRQHHPECLRFQHGQLLRLRADPASSVHPDLFRCHRLGDYRSSRYQSRHHRKCVLWCRANFDVSTQLLRRRRTLSASNSLRSCTALSRVASLRA